MILLIGIDTAHIDIVHIDIPPLLLGFTRGTHALFFNFLANIRGPQIGNLGSTVT